MMSDIWGEKPNIIQEGYYYNASEMDAWLEKLKAQEDALRGLNRRQFQGIGGLEKEVRGLKRRMSVPGLCTVCGGVCV